MNPQQRKDVEQKRIGDELYLYLPGGEALAVLNTTAMLIWSLCDGDHSPEDMLQIMLDIHDGADPNVMKADISACLQDFRQRGLLT